MGGAGLLLLIIAFGFLYFVLVRPQKRRQHRAAADAAASSKSGDEVVTAGGIYGEMSASSDDDVRSGSRPTSRSASPAGRSAASSPAATRTRTSVTGRAGTAPDADRRGAGSLQILKLRRQNPGTTGYPSGTVSDRRKYLLLIGAIAAALVGALLLAVPGSPVYQKPMLGLDLQGGLEVVLKAVPPKGHTLTPDDLEPVDLDHAEPHQQARRLRAGDPQAGQRPDRDPARRRAQPGRGSAADRQDGPAPALRLRDRPHRPVDRRERQPGRDADALRPAQAGADAGRAGHAGRRTTSSRRRRSRKPAKTKNGKPIGKPTARRSTRSSRPAPTEEQLLKPFGGKVPDGPRDPRRRRRTRLVVSCPTASGCLGAARASLADGDLLLPPEVLPARAPRTRCRR